MSFRHLSASGRVFAFCMFKNYIHLILAIVVIFAATLAYGLLHTEAPSIAQGGSLSEQTNAPTPVVETAQRTAPTTTVVEGYPRPVAATATTPAADSKGTPWNADVVEVPAMAGATVYDAMLAYQAAGEFSFTGKNYAGLGFMLDSINDKGPAGGKYWFLYVNGESAQTGASQTTLKAGDRVEWRYKKSE